MFPFIFFSFPPFSKPWHVTRGQSFSSFSSPPPPPRGIGGGSESCFSSPTFSHRLPSRLPFFSLFPIPFFVLSFIKGLAWVFHSPCQAHSYNGLSCTCKLLQFWKWTFAEQTKNSQFLYGRGRGGAIIFYLIKFSPLIPSSMPWCTLLFRLLSWTIRQSRGKSLGGKKKMRGIFTKKIPREIISCCQR